VAVTSPSSTATSPQFYFRTTDVTGDIKLPEGVKMVMPGDSVEMVVNLITPIAMEKELRFAIREGGKTVGAGVIAENLARLKSSASSLGRSGLFLGRTRPEFDTEARAACFDDDTQERGSARRLREARGLSPRPSPARAASA
jgi:hypothetical protein